MRSQLSTELSPSALRFALAALVCALAVWLLGLLAPMLPLPALVGFAIAYACVTAEILLLSWLAPRMPVAQSALVVGLCVLALLALARAPAEAPYAALLTLALGLGASSLGAAVGARIEKPGQLVAVALVSALADLWSVFDPSAPSARFAEQVLAHPEQLALFALPFPLFGTTLVPAVIGAGDVAFAALYVAAFRTHRLPVVRVLGALAVAFALGLLALLITLRPLPLLPLLGLSVLACDPAARSLSAREWRTVLTVCAGLVALMAWRVLH